MVQEIRLNRRTNMICLFVCFISFEAWETAEQNNLSIKNNIVEYSEENIISQFFFGGMNRLMIQTIPHEGKKQRVLDSWVEMFQRDSSPPHKKIKDASPQKKQPNRVFFKNLKVLWFFPLRSSPKKRFENPLISTCHHPNSDCLHRADAASS